MFATASLHCIGDILHGSPVDSLLNMVLDMRGLFYNIRNQDTTLAVKAQLTSYSGEATCRYAEHFLTEAVSIGMQYGLNLL